MKPTKHNIYIFEQISKHCDLNQKKVKYGCVRDMLGRYCIPKQIQNAYLQELQKVGLIKIVDKRHIVLVGQEQLREE